MHHPLIEAGVAQDVFGSEHVVIVGHRVELDLLVSTQFCSAKLFAECPNDDGVGIVGKNVIRQGLDIVAVAVTKETDTEIFVFLRLLQARENSANQIAEICRSVAEKFAYYYSQCHD